MNPTSHRYIVFVDGVSRWFPNLALAAWVIYSLSHELIHIDGMCLVIATKNQAEYDGVLGLLAASL